MPLLASEKTADSLAVTTIFPPGKSRPAWLYTLAPHLVFRRSTTISMSPPRPPWVIDAIVPPSESVRDGEERVMRPASPEPCVKVVRPLGPTLFCPDTRTDCVAAMLTSPPRPSPEVVLPRL